MADSWETVLPNLRQPHEETGDFKPKGCGDETWSRWDNGYVWVRRFAMETGFWRQSSTRQIWISSPSTR
jgi:hypothetical protein